MKDIQTNLKITEWSCLTAFGCFLQPEDWNVA